MGWIRQKTWRQKKLEKRERRGQKTEVGGRRRGYWGRRSGGSIFDPQSAIHDLQAFIFASIRSFVV
jgi:hypothetical protein